LKANSLEHKFFSARVLDIWNGLDDYTFSVDRCEIQVTTGKGWAIKNNR